jgi:hypothetical protein
VDNGEDDDNDSEFVGWGIERAEIFSLSTESPHDSSDDDDDVVAMPSLADAAAAAAATTTTSTTDAAMSTTATNAATVTTPTKAAAKPKEDTYMMVNGVSYKQRLSNACAMI